MLVKTQVMPIKKSVHRDVFINKMKKVIQIASEQTLKQFFPKYLSPSDTC